MKKKITTITKEFMKSPKKQVKVILIAIFLSMLILNIFTPLIADDYSYSFGLDGRIKNIIDIIKYQKDHYFTWGGEAYHTQLLKHSCYFPKCFLMLPML